MNVDSNTVTIVIGVIAFVSPIATTIINNRHQTKLKKLDMYEVAKRNALTNFIESAETVILSHNDDDLNNYFSSLNVLFIYFDNIYRSKFDKLSDNIKNKNSSTANAELIKLTQELSKQINKK